MTQSRELNDSQREINRRFRDLSWRVERLETSQMPARSLNESFDRVYEEIDALEDTVNQRFDRLETRIDRMETDLTGKIDLILRHVTG
jgi:ubiquinone biosynthesis protein UbiJ